MTGSLVGSVCHRRKALAMDLQASTFSDSFCRRSTKGRNRSMANRSLKLCMWARILLIMDRSYKGGEGGGGGGGGKEEGKGRREEDLLCRATEHNVHTYDMWHGGTAHIHTNLWIVALKRSVHCHVFDHIPNEVVHFAFLHTYIRTPNTHLATHSQRTQCHLEPLNRVNTS